MRELPAGLTLGVILGAIGFARIWGQYWLGLGTPPITFPMQIGMTIWVAVIGVVTVGTLVGSMLPFILRRFRLDPASASAPPTEGRLPTPSTPPIAAGSWMSRSH